MLFDLVLAPADPTPLRYAAVSAVAGYCVATLGCLLSALLVAAARASAAAPRRRLATYATLSLGAVAFWQTSAISVSGVSMTGSTVRYDAGALARSLAVGVVLAGAAVALACRPRPGQWRLWLAVCLIAADAAVTQLLSLAAVRAPGAISYDPLQLAIAVSITGLVAPPLVWSMLAPRRLGSVGATALGLGGLLAAGHYLGGTALRVEQGSGLVPVGALKPIQLLAPLLLFGVMSLAMLAFFALGSTTLRDLKLLYHGVDPTHTIDPWLIREVERRVAGEAQHRPLADLPHS